MTRVTNNSRETLNFAVGKKDGEVQMDHIRAGETKDLALDVESAVVKGQVRAGLITVHGGRTKAQAAAKPD